ncbi:hypothetical protein AZE42_13788 [Rhizopogon vesiculosus]|uniref:Uncharacterized protein n=1 Tax=Rhizopogon vesiculosus TaxID=180088 RepID=A0A1J8PZZ3_9AGAM|nr:hypothetical protein AZE42_13788 [Rhizopogon vesiculosus]
MVDKPQWRKRRAVGLNAAAVLSRSSKQNANTSSVQAMEQLAVAVD